jgi:AcrR family transcriptional regulator
MVSSTRDGILDATWRLLNEASGPLSMEDVASAAGISRQAVYLHFKSKADLVVAVVDHAKKNLGFERAAARIEDAKTAEDALLALFQMHAELTPKIVRASRTIEAERSRDPALDAAWQKREQSRLALIRKVVERLDAEGKLSKAWTVATAADLLWAMTAPGITEDLVVRRRWSREKLGDHLFHLIAGAMLEKGRRS